MQSEHEMSFSSSTPNFSSSVFQAQEAKFVPCTSANSSFQLPENSAGTISSAVLVNTAFRYHTCCSRYGKHELSVVFTMSILLGSSINKWETFSSKNQNIVILRWQSCFCESNLVTCINRRNGFHEPFSQEACVQGMPGTQHLLGNQNFGNVLQPDLSSSRELQKRCRVLSP